MVQSINTRAILTLATVARKPSLLVPQISVATVSEINYRKLAALGVKAVVFDKDHTLTAPYESSHIHPCASVGLNSALNVFGTENVAILSNSAGTMDDVDFLDAKQIEDELGLAVIRHQEKKPGGLQEVLDHFSIQDPTEICMVGDRILTDVVFGNLYGMVTVHTQPLPLEDNKDNWTARLIRPLENTVLYGGNRRKSWWNQRRMRHKLIDEDSIASLVHKDDTPSQLN